MKNLLGKKLIFIDGAMGTMLGDITALPETLNIENPDKIREIHTAYLESGADVITTNTFGANRLKLEECGYSVAEVVKAAVSIARECADRYGKLVTLDVGPLGTLLAPSGTLPFEEAVDIFKEIIAAGSAAGADMVSIETMTDTYEIKAAVLAAKESCSLPIVATMSLDETGRLLCGGDIVAMVALLEGLGVDVIGLNCGFGPVQFKEFFPKLREYSSTPIALLPNAGLPARVNGETVYDTTPEEFAKIMGYFAENGAWLLGGCCGTTPRHIKLMTEECKNITPKKIEIKGHTIVSSYAQAVELGAAPVCVGERINPTGKKRFKEALKNADYNYILTEGINQADAGADILDVNVGLPEIDEKAVMRRVVLELQGILSLPLQIDSSTPEVLEEALRIYNGKAMVNSVNGKRESMDTVFPIVKKYGGVVVGLTLDEKGIPSTVEGRVEIAKRIIDTAEAYGISKKDIIIDTLTLTVSAEQDEAKKTLEALKRVRNELGVCTILGVSNISFGLPRRDLINSTFFSIALANGLSAAIINPMSEGMMGALRAYCALAGHDKACARFVEAYSGQGTEKQPEKADYSLSEMIIKGLKALSHKEALALLTDHEPLDIINNHIIPALDAVGRDFEKGKVYLPQLLMSAETAQNAFAAIRERAPEGESRGDKIILATVKGDIHDIGKNIVKLLMQNYGFDVIDLGRDVPEDLIVKTAIEQNIRLVGLSALMTTTVVSMENTIRALRASGHECSVIVGGAVLNPEYAKMIGADFYGKDALSSVAYAKEFFGKQE
jgi:5-methyltetrahydrofolate--homocysteine methyltransferase